MKVPMALHRWEDETPPSRKRRMRKGMYILPSVFTAANIGAGYFAIAQTLEGHFNAAAVAIGIAVVADGLDGRVARLTNTTSDFGREFDSLADVIAFGVAPAILAWMWGFRMLPALGHPEVHTRFIQMGVIATFIFMVAGASRLARFNIQLNPQPSNPGRPGRKYFVGMPIPAGAGVVAATVHLFHGKPLASWWAAPAWFALLLLLSMLMVSTWRFYSFKDLNLKNRHPFQLLILICVFLALMFYFSRYLLFGIGMLYTISGILMRLSWIFRRRNPAVPSQEALEPR